MAYTAGGFDLSRTGKRALIAFVGELLIQNVMQLLRDDAGINPQDARSEVEKLERDLASFRAFLKDFGRKPNMQNLVKEIRFIIYEIEDAIDVYSVEEAANQGFRSFSIFRRRGRAPARLRSVVQQVDAVREKMKNVMDTHTGGCTDFALNTEAVTQIPKRAEMYVKGIMVREDNMVGFEDEAKTIIDHLTREREELDVISIIGFPGLGKTTLAYKIFNHHKIRYKFPIRVWISVSQEFNKRDVFLNILREFTNYIHDLTSKTDQEIVQILRKYLQKHTFLIILDDVWSAEAWIALKVAFPKTHTTGKILITSRHQEVALWANRNTDPHKLRFLSPCESWKLLQIEVFDKSACPLNLQPYGMHIVQKCGGVPLAIVAIAGILLKKSQYADTTATNKNTWRMVAQSVPTYLMQDRNVEDVVALSYDNLPYHLRPCFLYLGMFAEDFEIPVLTLIRMWIAEGFIQPEASTSLEQTARDYLKELISRNLVMIGRESADGQIKTCRIHSMLREFCKYESGSEKENFFQEFTKSAEGGFMPPIRMLETCHRVCIHSSDTLDFVSSQPSGPRVRSFLCYSREEQTVENLSAIPEAFELLKVLHIKPMKVTGFPHDLTRLIHLKFIVLSSDLKVIPQAISKLWNLQTLVVYTTSPTLSIEANIWEMIQLRHVVTNAPAILPKTKGSGGEKLQTLEIISPESCTEDVFNRACNLVTLSIRGSLVRLLNAKGLDNLDKLEKLKLVNDSCHHLPRLPYEDKFPSNLRKLTLCGTRLDWQHISTLAMLKNLEVLKLKRHAFMGESWDTLGWQFRDLEVLHIDNTDLVTWVACANDFPRLKRLLLRDCKNLKAVPYGLRDIESFKRLDLVRVNYSVIDSARKQLQEEADSNRNKFQLHITDI